MTTDPDKLVPKAVRNEIFYFIARFSMIVANLVGLPIAGWLLIRIVTQADNLQATVLEQTVTLRVLNSTVKDKLEANVQQLSDHELRIRALERRP